MSSNNSWVEVVEKSVEGILRSVVESLESDPSLLLGVENYFVLALLGRRANMYAKLERHIVTMVGGSAAALFKPFFTGVRDVVKPFDFHGTLKRNMRSYTVKVVLSDQAFNSTMQRRIEEASRGLENPIILTVQGPPFPPRSLGSATWLCAQDSWTLVTGEKYAYQKFRDTLFSVAQAYRSRVYAVIDRAEQMRQPSAQTQRRR